MRRLCLIVAMAAIGSPAFAADEDGSAIGDIFRLLIERMTDDMAPALQDMRTLLESIDDYHPPEVLPNGDIILRRKTPLPEVEPEPGGEVEL